MAIRFDIEEHVWVLIKRFDLHNTGNIREEKLDKSKFISLEDKPFVKSDFYNSTLSKLVKHSRVRIHESRVTTYVP